MLIVAWVAVHVASLLLGYTGVFASVNASKSSLHTSLVVREVIGVLLTVLSLGLTAAILIAVAIEGKPLLLLGLVAALFGLPYLLRNFELHEIRPGVVAAPTKNEVAEVVVQLEGVVSADIASPRRGRDVSEGGSFCLNHMTPSVRGRVEHAFLSPHRSFKGECQLALAEAARQGLFGFPASSRERVQLRDERALHVSVAGDLRTARYEASGVPLEFSRENRRWVLSGF